MNEVKDIEEEGERGSPDSSTGISQLRVYPFGVQVSVSSKTS